MTDLSTLSERDLIVLLHGKVDNLVGKTDDHEARIREIENAQNRARGFWDGANWLRGLLAALPVGVAGWFLGGQQ